MPFRFGGVQNLGVVPEYRGLGIGRALLLKALDGFALMGARRAFLEVTASNESAVRMYRSCRLPLLQDDLPCGRAPRVGNGVQAGR